MLKRNMNEKPPTAHLHKIEEDCESGGTEKSAHIEEVIKHDIEKKLRTVNFDAEENLASVLKPKKLSFSIKQIKLPAQKVHKPVQHLF